jgi:ABC-type multidrug transport system fused ATPase/permease subunit
MMYETTTGTQQAALHWLRYRPGLYLLNLLAGMAYESVPLATGLILRAFFDSVSHGAAAGPNAWSLLVLLVVAEGAHALASVAWGWIGFSCAYIYSALLRRNLLGWLFGGPGSRTLPGASGEVVSRLRDDVEQFWLYMEVWVDLAPTVVRSAIALAIMAAIQPLVTLVVFLPLVAIVGLVQLASNRITTYREANREATAAVTAFIGEAAAAVAMLKAAAAEERATAHFAQLNAARGRAALRDTVLGSLLDSFNGNAAAVGTGLILLLVGSQLRAGSFTVGDLALFVTYMAWTEELPFWVGEVITRYRQAGVSLGRLHALLPGAPPHTLTAPAPRSR